ncbi:hypothetical protein FGADI_5762 [Fusarium gaditjirri]|uniref:Uncharacterized protein n=1 Tax=Fusarium gaditjirri TaxID=282569 RepID=A0A8H4T9I3_9HYPO|nr:hypothetical protein FGADI_5762 [Fusarium gaditjirri]
MSNESSNAVGLVLALAFDNSLNFGDRGGKIYSKTERIWGYHLKLDLTYPRVKQLALLLFYITLILPAGQKTTSTLYRHFQVKMYFSNVVVTVLAAQAFSQDSRVSRSSFGQVAALMAAAALPADALALPIFSVEKREPHHQGGQNKQNNQAQAQNNNQAQGQNANNNANANGCNANNKRDEELVARHHQGNQGGNANGNANGNGAAAAANGCNNNNNAAANNANANSNNNKRDEELVARHHQGAKGKKNKNGKNNKREELVARHHQGAKGKKNRNGKNNKREELVARHHQGAQGGNKAKAAGANRNGQNRNNAAANSNNANKVAAAGAGNNAANANCKRELEARHHQGAQGKQNAQAAGCN